MRIISGELKGRRITAPKKLPVRPTTDRAKEALFNILNHRLEWQDICTLDLYAGTGNISYELASRGVQKLTAVDQNKHCAHFIYQTNEALGLPITVVKNSVEKFLEHPIGAFDFIFADPPYAFTEETLLALANTLLENNWLTENGLLIIEHDKHLDLKHHRRLSEERTYGSSRFSFFE
ncbi:MAG: 16S rRNA (guanine(966)-N(2))-methyltransferase RsmD [Flavobacteriaceae bacterium]|nr:16S rRNA (guanine(966)-N(2))-methyltransferase RsmD [Flavobacteriaceae bacterium]